jgi:hypothetical protein
VQTYLAKKAMSYLSTELGTVVEIQRVEVDFFDQLTLRDLYIEDKKGDTLAFFEDFNLKVSGLSLEKKWIKTALQLQSPYLNIYRLAGDSTFNYQFLLDYFSSSDTSQSEPYLSDFQVSDLNVSAGVFKWHDFNKDQLEGEFDYEHLDVDLLNLSASGIQLDEEHIAGNIQGLSLREKKGFRIKKLSTYLDIDSQRMSFENTTIQTPGTELQVDIQFKVDSLGGYGNFIEEVDINAIFSTSLINVKDLAYFVPSLYGIQKTVYLDGKVQGTIANLSASEIEVQLNKETRLRGDFDIRGLPDWETTFIHLDLEEFTTTAEGLRQLPYPPFSEQNHVQVPDNFDQLGRVSFQGSYTGFYDDFVAYGRFVTALGELKTDIALRKLENGDYAYKGALSSSKFQVGRFAEVEDLKSVSLNVEVDGKGTDKENLYLKVKGLVTSLEYKGYDYKNITLDGALQQQQFKGKLTLDDPNLAFRFNGLFNNNEKIPTSNFKLEVSRANLAKLNLFNAQDSLTEVSLSATLDLKGKELDDLEGSMQITDLSYKDSEYNYLINEFNLQSHIAEDNKRKLEINSDVLDANLEGSYQFSELGKTLNAFLLKYIDEEEQTKFAFNDQQIQFKIILKNTEPITQVLIGDLLIDSATVIEGRFNSKLNKLNYHMYGRSLSYSGNELRNFSFKLSAKPDSLFSSLNAMETDILQLKKIRKLSLQSFLSGGNNVNELKWEGNNKKLGIADIQLMGKFNKQDQAQFSFSDKSYFTINDSIWRINNRDSILIDSNRFYLADFMVGNDKQRLTVNGGIGGENDTLDVRVDSLNLEYVSSLFPEGTLQLMGIADGQAEIYKINGSYSLITALSLSNLVANEVALGGAFLESIYQPRDQSLNVKGTLGKKEDRLFMVVGKVLPQTGALDLELEFDDFPLPFLSQYIDDYLSSLEGSIDGKVALQGTVDKPEMSGYLELNQTRMKVNYLNTFYTVNDRVIIQPDFIGFDLIEITDRNGSKAIATGTIFHSNYSDFNLDIGLDFNNFFVLNTTAKDNELYYGKAIASGTANISGYANQLILEIDVESEDGTSFNIPLTDEVSVSSSDFLVFTNSPDYQKNDAKEVDLDGIQLNFDLKINPSTDIQIIFDEQIGDIMKANGTGQLKLEINTLGDFNIFGRYVIQKGSYLFTLRNIINKHFDLREGSSIAWDGDPYEARLDMKAVYNLRAPLYDLFPNDSTIDSRRRVPVELELILKNSLLSPDIDFDIKLPTADDLTRRKLESILYVNNNEANRQEMNQQVFGLLVLNRFMPSASSTAASEDLSRGAPGINNGYEFLSNQLSNWFSRLSDQFDVGLNYRPADELNSEEVDVSLSTEILNDRLILDGNFGYSSNSANYNNNRNAPNFIGEFKVEYKLSKDGRYRVKGFNRSTNNSLLQTNSPYTQGVGLFYREEFNNWSELWRKYFRKEEKE